MIDFYYNLIVFLVYYHLWLPALIGMFATGWLLGTKCEHWRFRRQVDHLLKREQQGL